jgi:hypothetical protein
VLQQIEERVALHHLSLATDEVCGIGHGADGREQSRHRPPLED